MEKEACVDLACVWEILPQPVTSNMPNMATKSFSSNMDGTCEHKEQKINTQERLIAMHFDAPVFGFFDTHKFSSAPAEQAGQYLPIQIHKSVDSHLNQKLLWVFGFCKQ